MRKIFMASLVLLLNLLLPISAFAFKEVYYQVKTVWVIGDEENVYSISNPDVARIINDNGNRLIEFYRPGDVTIVVITNIEGYGTHKQEYLIHVKAENVPINNNWKPNDDLSSDEYNLFFVNDKPVGSGMDLAREMLEIINAERAKVGAHPLVLDSMLMEGCKIRARELVQSFSHTRPDGRDFQTSFGKNNVYAGENITAGVISVQQAMNNWMKSPGHRENILNKNYRKFGLGYYFEPKSQYGHYWVQIFMGKVR